MLTELKDLEQRRDEPQRRWFRDDFFDLIVWFNDREEIVLFQLGYDPDGADGLLEWRPLSGLSHFKVDTAGRRPARHARTPFLVPAPAPELGPLVDDFEKRAGEIDPDILAFVMPILRG